jgi:hypothetical protein
MEVINYVEKDEDNDEATCVRTESTTKEDQFKVSSLPLILQMVYYNQKND